MNGKRQEWLEYITENEVLEQQERYNEIMNTRKGIYFDIQRDKYAMKQIVVQQLGDKFGYDKSLNKLEKYVKAI